MSRVAKKPIAIPAGIEWQFKDRVFSVKGKGVELSMQLHQSVDVKEQDGAILVFPLEESKRSWMHAGTARSLINNMFVGASTGFERRLQLNGVGYRAQAKGRKLNVSVGYSHPVEFDIPQEVSVETPSQTEIVLKSADKQLLGETAARIRRVRPPEPYKGKGIRYSDEVVHRKEAKKK